MLFQTISYLKFIWHSKNEHGVHSPFIFNLLTKCLYNNQVKNHFKSLKIKSANYKRDKLLFSIVQYLQPNYVLIQSDTNTTNKLIIQAGNPSTIIDIETNRLLYDFIYFDKKNSLETTSDSIDKLLATVTNNSFWIFEKIHSNKTTESLWESIKSHNKVTVTIDSYHFGIVFFRKEQAKEHFTLRI